jgi:gas vesicle protein GvpN
MSNNGSGSVSEATVRIRPGDDNVWPEASEGFVSTREVQALSDRALTYLRVGYPVHFSGPAGTGKTTLALHIASKLGRPVALIHGDDEFASSDLVGNDHGYRKSKLVDNFIHSVLKTEEEMKTLWMDNRLTTACQNGDTLIYDEFTRSRPEANNVLLSILGERILNLPKLRRSGEGYLEVHPEFRAIFTSNPEEYAGVHKTQDALMDRLITITLGHYDRATEVVITVAKSGIPEPDAEAIVDLVRELRGVGVNNHRPTIRACIAIARILSHKEARARPDDPVFRWICQDVLNTDTAKVTRGGESLMPQRVDEAIQKVCGPRPGRPEDRVGNTRSGRKN